MIILQIAPVIGVGTGVGSVAYHLEQEWSRLGHDVRRLELKDAFGSWLPEPGPGVRGKAALAARVVWFSTVGTLVARREIAKLPTGSIVICHNDVLAGDVYVNHGVLQTSLMARGHARLRMLRNPLHLFITARDRLRYTGRWHRVVVNLTSADDAALRTVYPNMTLPTWIIGNGVDTDHFRPPTELERGAARERLGLKDSDLLTIFIGHEYARKGLYPLLEAIAVSEPRHHLVVVGGDDQMVDDLRARAQALGCLDRCHLVGVADPRPYLWSADALAQPSAYESYGLVVTEALACGVPVITTPVGVAPDVIQHGVTGYFTAATTEDLARQLAALEQADRPTARAAAREAAVNETWSKKAAEYLRHFATLCREAVSESGA